MTSHFVYIFMLVKHPTYGHALFTCLWFGFSTDMLFLSWRLVITCLANFCEGTHVGRHSKANFSNIPVCSFPPAFICKPITLITKWCVLLYKMYMKALSLVQKRWYYQTNALHFFRLHFFPYCIEAMDKMNLVNCVMYNGCYVYCFNWIFPKFKLSMQICLFCLVA